MEETWTASVGKTCAFARLISGLNFENRRQVPSLTGFLLSLSIYPSDLVNSPFTLARGGTLTSSLGVLFLGTFWVPYEHVHTSFRNNETLHEPKRRCEHSQNQDGTQIRQDSILHPWDCLEHRKTFGRHQHGRNLETAERYLWPHLMPDST